MTKNKDEKWIKDLRKKMENAIRLAKKEALKEYTKLELKEAIEVTPKELLDLWESLDKDVIEELLSLVDIISKYVEKNYVPKKEQQQKIKDVKKELWRKVQKFQQTIKEQEKKYDDLHNDFSTMSKLCEKAQNLNRKHLVELSEQDKQIKYFKILDKEWNKKCAKQHHQLKAKDDKIKIITKDYTEANERLHNECGRLCDENKTLRKKNENDMKLISLLYSDIEELKKEIEELRRK